MRATQEEQQVPCAREENNKSWKRDEQPGRLSTAQAIHTTNQARPRYVTIAPMRLRLTIDSLSVMLVV
jgi:hypothetical protein